MTKPTQQQRTDALAEWAGLKIGTTPCCKHHLYRRKPGDAWRPWEPFTDLNDARLLLLECDRLGLLGEVIVTISWIDPVDLLLLKPDVITEAVWAVAFPEEKT